MRTIGLCLCLLGLVACGQESKAEGKAQAAAARIEPLAYPLSHRPLVSSLPPGTLKLDLDLEGLSRAGKVLIKLQAGKCAERSCAPLKQALSVLPKSGNVALSVHAMVPYPTLLALLQALHNKGVQRLYFAARAAPTPTRLAWLLVDAFDTPQDAKSKVSFAQLTPSPWNDFLKVWNDLYQRCRALGADCSEPPERAPKGGNLEIALLAIGGGTRLRFRRTDPPAKLAIEYETIQVMNFDSEDDKPQFKKRIKSVREVKEKVDEDAPPQEALFTFRSASAQREPDPIAALSHSGCAAPSCALRFVGDALVSSGQALTLLSIASMRFGKPLAIAFEDLAAAP